MGISDVILSKISIINNCLNTIEKATGNDPVKLDDIIMQDVFVLNLQRAVQACIDIANHLIAQNEWKLPATYRESFQTLREKKIISEKIATQMIKMVGFRNIAVHDYQSIDLQILKGILTHNLDDFNAFRQAILKYLKR